MDVHNGGVRGLTNRLSGQGEPPSTAAAVGGGGPVWRRAASTTGTTAKAMPAAPTEPNLRSNLARRAALALATLAVATLALAARADDYSTGRPISGRPGTPTIGRANLDGDPADRHQRPHRRPRGHAAPYGLAVNSPATKRTTSTSSGRSGSNREARSAAQSDDLSRRGRTSLRPRLCGRRLTS